MNLEGSWQAYADGFLDLMRQRRIEAVVSKEMMDSACLLCSEEKPHHCHRRLVAEYLQEHWGTVETRHLT